MYMYATLYVDITYFYTDTHTHVYKALYCLINWTDEDNQSVVPIKRVKSPPPDDITAGCFSKLKGSEK